MRVVPAQCSAILTQGSVNAKPMPKEKSVRDAKMELTIVTHKIQMDALHVSVLIDPMFVPLLLALLKSILWSTSQH